MGVLEGITVVELSIAIAAPSCCRALAFHGADVIKVESRTNPDVARLFGSAWAAGMDAGPYMDTSPYLAEMSANKRSVGLELKDPSARRAALALIATADVFVTNYSTPAVRALGLGRRRPRWRSTRPSSTSPFPGFGSDPDQPYYEFLAWGPNQAPLVGLDELTGYPDQVPAGIATIAPPDYFAGLHALAAVLTALEHRDGTGEGTFVDIAQFETTVSSLGPFLLDHAVSGHEPGRVGNRLPWLAPQGCYRCEGDDAWVAVTVDDDERWAAVADLLGGARARRPLRDARRDGSRTTTSSTRSIGAWTSTPTGTATRPSRCRPSASPRARSTTTPACCTIRRSASGSGSSCSDRAASPTVTCSAVTPSASVPSPAAGGGPVRRWVRTPAPCSSSGPG